MVLVHGRHHVVAAVLAAVFVIGPMWFAPRGHFLELKDNWWQAVACVSHLVVALTYMTFFASSRQPSQTGRSAS
jgi:SNF family Na+-dependent transporter